MVIITCLEGLEQLEMSRDRAAPGDSLGHAISEGRCAPKAPSLRSDAKAPSKPHGLTQTLFLVHSTRYEEELSLRPCAENEFIALKKVSSCSEREKAPELGLRTLSPWTVSKRVCSPPTAEGSLPLLPWCQPQ